MPAPCGNSRPRVKGVACGPKSARSPARPHQLLRGSTRDGGEKATAGRDYARPVGPSRPDGFARLAPATTRLRFAAKMRIGPCRPRTSLVFCIPAQVHILLMVIDCHGHYTTAPKELQAFRDNQIAALKDPTAARPKTLASLTDDQLRESVQPQLKFQSDRGTDVTIFSPRASAMAHHIGDAETSLDWSRHCNDLIYRVCELFPKNFVGVCQLPQTPSAPLANCIEELERCVNELGFIGCNLNPDPSGGHWTAPPLTDKFWYPFYEKMVELDVPAMVHVSASCNANFHATGAHYINADTTAFMQFLQADLFKDIPTLRMIIPHGGGAVPYHWGRYRGLAQDMKRPLLTDLIRDNVFFDTCVYHQPGLDLLLKVVPAANVLFGSGMVGGVRCIDPETGHYRDDTERYVEGASITDAERRKLLEGTARKVYPRINRLVPASG